MPFKSGTLHESPAAVTLKDQEFSFLHEGPPAGEHFPDVTLVLSEIRQAIAMIAAERLVKLVLFGSRARGDWDPGSAAEFGADEAVDAHSLIGNHRTLLYDTKPYDMLRQ